MAGIGFQLKKTLSDETYSGMVKGYFFAAVIAAGPWIFSVLSINILSYFVQKYVSFESFQFFNTIITYSFCFSLILFGLLDTVITRYLADKLYFQEKNVLTSSFLAIWLFVMFFMTCIAGPFYYFSDIDPFFRVMGFVFFLILCSIWLAMLFISAARSYVPIVVGFVLGGFVSYFLGRYLGLAYGIKGVFFGYLCGQVVILFVLILQIYREFSFQPHFSLEWLRYYKKFPLLILIGFSINMWLWVDKIMFWFSKEDGKHVAGFFYNDIHYGSTLFIAYLTMIPALTIFLVRIETTFYAYYKKFFQAIDQKKGLKEILLRKEEMVVSLKQTIFPLLATQGFFTLSIIVLAPQILDFLHLPTTTLAIFRISVLGVFLQALTIITGVLILYLLEYKKVILVYVSAFFVNIVLTKITLWLGFPFWGLGFTLSSLYAFIMMFRILDQQIDELDFRTFFGQPLVQPRMYKTQSWEPTETLSTPEALLVEEEAADEKAKDKNVKGS